MTYTGIYHDKLIKLITSHPKALEEMVEFSIDKIVTNIHYHYTPTDNLELDILVTNKNQKAIIEVKSRYESKKYFLKNQFPRYLIKFPNTKIFFMYPLLPYYLNIYNVAYEEIARIK